MPTLEEYTASSGSDSPESDSEKEVGKETSIEIAGENTACTQSERTDNGNDNDEVTYKNQKFKKVFKEEVGQDGRVYTLIPRALMNGELAAVSYKKRYLNPYVERMVGDKGDEVKSGFRDRVVLHVKMLRERLRSAIELLLKPKFFSIAARSGVEMYLYKDKQYVSNYGDIRRSWEQDERDDNMMKLYHCFYGSLEKEPNWDNDIVEKVMASCAIKFEGESKFQPYVENPKKGAPQKTGMQRLVCDERSIMFKAIVSAGVKVHQRTFNIRNKNGTRQEKQRRPGTFNERWLKSNPMTDLRLGYWKGQEDVAKNGGSRLSETQPSEVLVSSISVCMYKEHPLTPVVHC